MLLFGNRTALSACMANDIIEKLIFAVLLVVLVAQKLHTLALTSGQMTTDHFLSICCVFSHNRCSRSASWALWRGPHCEALCSLSGGRTYHVSWDQFLPSTSSPAEHIQLPRHKRPVPWGDQVGFKTFR